MVLHLCGLWSQPACELASTCMPFLMTYKLRFIPIYETLTMQCRSRTLHHPLMATSSTTGRPTETSHTYVSIALMYIYILSQQLISHLKPQCGRVWVWHVHVFRAG